jgi:cytochrome P450
MTSDVFTFNPFAAGFTDNPYPHYAELREVAPAYDHPLGFWILSRYEDVHRLQRAGHSMLERNLTRLPVWRSDTAAMGTQNRWMGGLSMLDQDPPEHTRLRRLVNKAFTRGALEAMRPRIAAVTDQALDRIAAAGRADVVAELAFPVPFAVISELLGIPVADEGRVQEIAGTLTRQLEPMPDPTLQAQVRSANDEFTAIVRDLAAWKRANPGDDLFSALIAATDDGDKLTEDELIAQVMLIYIAGHETTVNLVSNSVFTLLQHPAQLRALHREPGLIGNAVEELLRYEPPLHLMRRVTVEPFTAAGVEIPPGNWVIGALAAANRDPGFWGADAGELRLDRPEAHQHLSFSAGVHHCLGAGLARVEAQVIIGRFVGRFPSAELADFQWNGRINVRGLQTLTVTV